jgi:hypothetical protein
MEADRGGALCASLIWYAGVVIAWIYNLLAK